MYYYIFQNGSICALQLFYEKNRSFHADIMENALTDAYILSAISFPSCYLWLAIFSFC